MLGHVPPPGGASARRREVRDEVPETIFDKILAGDIPSYTVYEDEHVYSFLDINPIVLGHTLLIPRERKAYLHELSDEAAAALGRALPRIARAVLAATGAEHYNVLQNNGAPAHQAVFHVHFHVIPKIGDSGLGIGWKQTALSNEVAGTLLAKMQTSLEAEG
jgi:histidine triad (HIT) family protein